MAHAKKVNFHILSQIEFPVDFGPGVLGPLAPKGQNGQTYNAQFHQEPSKNSAKLSCFRVKQIFRICLKM
jgi:hypothetical protein